MTPQLDTLAELLAKVVGHFPLAPVIEVCTPHYGNPSSNILPVTTKEFRDSLAAVNYLRDNLPAIREQADEVERDELLALADRVEARACDTCLHLARHEKDNEHYYRCDAPITYPANVLFGHFVAPDPTIVSRWITTKVVHEQAYKLKPCPLWQARALAAQGD